jgi:hypothetical protein
LLNESGPLCLVDLTALDALQQKSCDADRAAGVACVGELLIEGQGTLHSRLGIARGRRRRGILQHHAGPKVAGIVGAKLMRDFKEAESEWLSTRIRGCREEHIGELSEMT